MEKNSMARGIFSEALMKWILKTQCFLVSALAIIVLASPPSFAAGDAKSAGDTLVMGTIGEASNLIPFLATDSASSEVAEYIFIAPLKYDQDLKIVPWAAESYEVLDGGQRFRFTLRPGILWEDGVELTAADVEFTYKTMIDPNTPTAYSERFKVISSFTVTDKYSFEVTYNEPFAQALETWMQKILPKHIFANENLRETRYARAPVGAGPYKFKQWAAGSRIVLEANPLYFEGRPNIDKLVFVTIPDITTMFLELKAGALDMMGLTPQQYMFQGKDLDKTYNGFQYPSFSYTYLGYNHESPLFSDVRVRQAIAHVVDKQEIIAGALLGLGQPTIGPYPPGSWAYNAHIKDYPIDVAKAEKLLGEAGWKKDGKGMLRNAKGLPFVFTIMTNQGNEQRIKTAIIIQSQLKRLGMDVSVRTVEWATFFSQFVNKGYYDAIILGWTTPLDPNLFDVWHSSNMRPNGLNFMKYANSELDILIEQGRKTFNQAERKRIYDRAQEILHHDQPYCFLYVPYALPVVHKRFKGITQTSVGITYNLKDWWVPKAEQKHSVTP